MGMFDDIKYEAPCPMCGARLAGWQSKDGGCSLAVLTPAELKADAGPGRIQFYTSCHRCGTWVDITLDVPEVSS